MVIKKIVVFNCTSDDQQSFFRGGGGGGGGEGGARCATTGICTYKWFSKHQQAYYNKHFFLYEVIFPNIGEL